MSKSNRQKRETFTMDFSTLPDAEKDKVFAEIESKTPEQILAESRPLNAQERAFWNALRKRWAVPRSARAPRSLP